MQDIRSIAERIDRCLPELARNVIRSHLDLDSPANRRFLEEPDGREQHQTRWHQWGIITHTRVFLRHFHDQVPDLLRRWGLWQGVKSQLEESVDGASKWQLLHISILLHDIGKFAARTSGRYRFHFSHHEAMSGIIIRSQLDLAQYGLTPDQIKYVALTAEDHFVLALERKRVRAEGMYHTDYLQTRSFIDLSRRIRVEHPDDFLEIGVLFLGDSLAKADPSEGPEDALDQYDINIAIARRYLEVILRSVQ